MPAIEYHLQQTTFKLKQKKEIKSWLSLVAASHKCNIKNLQYIFCDDAYLVTLNKSFLNHDTFTDIITFDYTDEKSFLCGEIYISVERVKENALKFGVRFDEELHRVIVHGLLHLIGYKDKSKAEKEQMRKLEEAALRRFSKIN